MVPLSLLGCVLVILLATAWVGREVVRARRALRPARIGVVCAGAAILAGAASVGVVSGVHFGALFGVPRRYATYEPAPAQAFDARILVVALGFGLLTGALLGEVRTSDGTVHDDLPAARTRNRLFAAAGGVLVVVGAVLLAVR